MEVASGFGRIALSAGLASLRLAVRPCSSSVLGVVPVVWSRFLSGDAAAPALLSTFAPALGREATWGRTGLEADSCVISLGAVLQMASRTAGGSVDADVPV